MNWINAKDRLPDKPDTVYVYGIGHAYLRYEPDFDECAGTCEYKQGETARDCLKHANIAHWTEASCCGYPSHKVTDSDYWIPIDDIPKPEMK